MSNNLYEVLGVDEKAEIEVIKAAHKALAKKYHPDTFEGDKKLAEENLKRINAAFDILSDPKKPRQYDNDLRGNKKSSDFDEEEDTDFSGDEFGEKVLLEDWSVVVEVYPEAEAVRKRLYKYSPKLGFTFQILTLSQKTAPKATSTGRQLKDEFLSKYFGTNRELKRFVEDLLFNGKRHIC